MGILFCHVSLFYARYMPGALFFYLLSAKKRVCVRADFFFVSEPRTLQAQLVRV